MKEPIHERAVAPALVGGASGWSGYRGGWNDFMKEPIHERADGKLSVVVVGLSSPAPFGNDFFHLVGAMVLTTFFTFVV